MVRSGRGSQDICLTDWETHLLFSNDVFIVMCECELMLTAANVRGWRTALGAVLRL